MKSGYDSIRFAPAEDDDDESYSVIPDVPEVGDLSIDIIQEVDAAIIASEGA